LAALTACDCGGNYDSLKDSPKKTKKSLFEPPFLYLRVTDNVDIPSIARWKARGRLYIRHNGTLSAISYG